MKLNSSVPVARTGLICLLWVTLLFPVKGQETERIAFKHLANDDFYRRVQSFSEISWVTTFTDYGSEKGYYIVSADISPHFNVGGERLPFVLQFTPRYKVRLFRNSTYFNDRSLPVRTPSYVPGMTLYLPLRKKQALETPGTYDRYSSMNYLGLSVVHHSNGQDGPEIDSVGNYNIYNGNFSTSYTEPAFYFNKRVKHEDAQLQIPCNGRIDCGLAAMPYGYTDFYGKAGVEYHFYTIRKMRGRYGRARLNLKFGIVRTRNSPLVLMNSKGHSPKVRNAAAALRMRSSGSQSDTCNFIGRCYQKEYIRMVANLSIIADKLDANHRQLNKRINAEVAMYIRIASGNTAWFIMTGYYGSDPYNAYFEKHYFFIRTGLALGSFTYMNKFNY